MIAGSIYCLRILACLVFLGGLGCVGARQQTQMQTAFAAYRPDPAALSNAIDVYRLACPDVIELVIDGYPAACGQFIVNAEGRVENRALQTPRIEGETTGMVVQQVAQMLAVPLEQVHCRVVEYRSRAVYLHGLVVGPDRAVPYQGPETVSAFLRRSGGLRIGADPKNITVIRPNLCTGGSPELFHIDLEGILNGDPASNIVLQAFDEVYIGELRGSKLGKVLPCWMRPVYHRFCEHFPGMCPPDWREQNSESDP